MGKKERRERTQIWRDKLINGYFSGKIWEKEVQWGSFRFALYISVLFKL